MKYEGNRVSDLKITYIGGGSRGWAWGLMSDLAVESNLSGCINLYDIDFDAAKANEIIGNRLSSREDVPGKWSYKAISTLSEALSGADFVIISILPGTFEEMASDVHTPEKYGIFQSVGDSVGPGGLIRALRTIPMYVDIANAIKANCPKAWVINYTNPMTLCTRTLYRVFPEIKAFGCCHEVFGTQSLLLEALKDIKGIENIKREDIKINVLGINHFTWIDKASYKGLDLFPIYNEFSEKYYIEGFEGNEKNHWMNNFFSSAQRVKFDLFKRYGVIAAAGDRHLAEAVPGNWYLKDKDTVKHWKFSLTPVCWRKENLKERLEKSAKLKNASIAFDISETGEEGVKQIKAILGLEDLITNVNIPNYGQMRDVPIGAVVETNALFRRDSVTPILAGKLPSPVHSLVIRQIENQETILEAAITHNKDLAFQAFVNDPLVNLSTSDAEKLFQEMLSNTLKYLPKAYNY